MAMAGSSDEEQRASFSSNNATSTPAHLTVWRQSLLFNGNGYTVYDGVNGNLVFRVENYACDSNQEMFLMDSFGHVLFTISRRSSHIAEKLCVMESWEAFKGDKEQLAGYDNYGHHQKPFMIARKNFRNPSCSITVATGDKYRINWSNQEGWLKIFLETSLTLPIAQVSRKCGCTPESSSLGKDVFTLIIHPRVDQAMVMAMVMISDAMMR